LSDQPRVSVLMTVYNGGDGLARTLDSLQQQTFQDFELVIIDDGSTDGTWDTISRIERSRVRAHRNLNNQGQTASLNMALKLAEGQYVARQDAEDISLPERFEKQVAYLDQHPAVALVGTQIDWVDAAGRLVRHFEYPTENEAIAEQLKTKNSFGHGSVMVRRDVLEETGGYREAFRLAQDYDLWLRIAQTWQAANLPETLYKMRFSARMVSVVRNAEQGAYAELARQLAGERAAHGKEQTDVEAAGAALAAQYDRGFLARRIEQSRNYIIWAERLLWWGEPAARYAWPVWSYALGAWPFNLRVWKYLAREIRQAISRLRSE
jgi:glycosyltransferase involved in cell wall biosynthesis